MVSKIWSAIGFKSCLISVGLHSNSVTMLVTVLDALCFLYAFCCKAQYPTCHKAGLTKYLRNRSWTSFCLHKNILRNRSPPTRHAANLHPVDFLFQGWIEILMVGGYTIQPILYLLLTRYRGEHLQNRGQRWDNLYQLQQRICCNVASQVLIWNTIW